MVETKKNLIYDAVSGKWIRELRDNDIFNVSTTSTNTSGASGVVLQGTVGSGLEVYGTQIYVASSSANSTGYMTIGTSTLFAFSTGASGSGNVFSVSNSKNAYLFKASALSTITIIGTTQAGYTAFVTGNRYPTYSNVETEG